MDALTIRLRQWCETVRRRPSPLADAIPMVQEAAATIEATSVELTRLRAENAEHSRARDRLEAELRECDREIAALIAERDAMRDALKPFAAIDLTTNQSVDAMDVLRARIDTADHVFHAPTGETWVVKYVRGDNLAWCGWPPGEAKLGDCTLVKKASSVERESLLREMEGK